MNVFIGMALMVICLGSLMSLLDHQYYCRATIQLLIKQTKRQYEQREGSVK